MSSGKGLSRRGRPGRRRHHRFGQSLARAFGDIGIPREHRGTMLVVALAIVIMMVTGGGVPGLLATAAMALVGIALLACLAFGPQVPRDLPFLFRLGLLGIAVLPLLQIVPLPPAIWHGLPGQELRREILALAGTANSWQPLSVTPLFTSGAAVIAIAFVALVLALLALPATSVRLLATLVLGMVGITILIGLIQVATGGQVLRLHRAADHGALLGFYANKNHAALVLAASLPLAAYVLGSRGQVRGTRVWLGLYAGVVTVALVTTNSRAGIGLGLATLVLLAGLYVRNVRPAYAIAAVTVAALGAILLSTTSAFDVVFSRFGNVDEDLRWQFLRTSMPLIERYGALGSGIGSFSTLYAANESLAWVKPTLVNQLHDEYPQLLLEAGVPGLVLLVALALGCVQRVVRTWRQAGRDTRLPMLCGAAILALAAIHSIVDYPLRRPAVLPVFALGLVLVMRRDLTATTGLIRRKQRP